MMNSRKWHEAVRTTGPAAAAMAALVLTLGLFYFVLNGLLLWGFSKLLPGYDVAGFVPGLMGSLVIWVVNLLLGIFGIKK